jgi:hypothetical protein
MGECLLFSKGSSRTSGCAWRHMGRFLVYDHGRRPSTKKYYPETHHPCVSLCCASGFLGRMRETKITNTELNWLYSALPGSQSTPLSYDQPVVLLSNIEFGRSSCYLSMLAISLKTAYYKEPESSPTRDFPRIWIYEERQIYKCRWERRLQSGQSKLTPSGLKIKTFFEGKKIG